MVESQLYKNPNISFISIEFFQRTRGYFARKLVREMREKELNILNMTPESYIRKRCAERERKRKEGLAGGVGGGEIIEQIEEFVSLYFLKQNFDLFFIYFRTPT